MQSVARNHFPQYVFRNGAKLLWNPILKKAFIDRPEERVRLQIVEYLVKEADFSTSRISFESPVNLPRDKSTSRTDVICFDKKFIPYLLIECKAPEIKLDEKASVQIARYNQKVGAPFLLISNGLEDFWFKSEDNGSSLLSNIPDTFQSVSTPDINFGYWCKRGFAGNKSHPDTREWIDHNCTLLFGDKTKSPNYFKFEGTPDELYMQNYYRIFEGEDSKNIAISFTATPFGSTKLSAVLNSKGKNKALLSCSLDLLANKDSKNTIMHDFSGRSVLDISQATGFDLQEDIPAQLDKLIYLLDKTV